MSKGKNGGKVFAPTGKSGLETCENCERVYNLLVNDYCPFCRTPDRD